MVTSESYFSHYSILESKVNWAIAKDVMGLQYAARLVLFHGKK